MRYINSFESKTLFQRMKRSDYFVDKSELVSAVVSSMGIENCYLCLTRPRRFGKSTNARMLACFLSRGLDAGDLFNDLKIAKDKEVMQHFGCHDVIYIDFSLLPQKCENYQDYITFITDGIISDIRELYPEVEFLENQADVFDALSRVFAKTGKRFTFVMDEWDSMFFNDKFCEADQKEFLMFLKQLLKGRAYVELAYMTGILPIAKHSTGSELNMFTEFSAAEDPRFDDYFGFTEDEVRALCKVHKTRLNNLGKSPKIDYDDLKFWYDGYFAVDGTSRFNPRSVVLALGDDCLRSYWTESGPYDEIYYYVQHNIDDVRDDLARMVAGEKVRAKMRNYAASSMTLNTKDEIFSAMTVYGFLTYYNGCVSIPNHELMLKFQDVMEKKDMQYVAKLAKRSEETLAATLRGDEDMVAEVVQAAHDQEIPLFRYAYEADLAALINLVYLSARDRYFVKREQPAGKGVADIAFVPMHPEDAALTPFIVELKVAQDFENAKEAALRAIEQIKEKNYISTFKDALTNGQTYANEPLAVAISWDPKSKDHACKIEQLKIRD